MKVALQEVTFPRLLRSLVASEYFKRYHARDRESNVLDRIAVALRRENVRPWHEVEFDFLECEYRAVRDRQMQELEQEDDIMSRVAIRCVSPFYVKPCIHGIFFGCR